MLGSVALFYAYGAAVHAMNIAGLAGFDWSTAPLKWQVLDVVYLILDLIVAVGFWRPGPVSATAFYIAAISQMALYTAGRTWILDVPDALRPPADQVAYLDQLVLFHIITLVTVTASLFILQARTRTSEGT